MAAKSKPNEIYIERVYDAPVKAVWDAWTDPEQVGKWWGPRGFTLTTKSKDLRPGGRWVYTMHGPDGTDWPNSTLYHEVEKYKLLVYDHGSDGTSPPLFKVTVRFNELNGKTKMEMWMGFANAEAAAESRKFIKKAGGDSTWDRLAEFLDEKVQGRERFVINRVFDAPLSLMYDMWTKPEHISKWVPPTGMEMEFIHADIRPGGHSFYVMYNDQGMKMYGRAEYKEMNKRDRVTYSQQFVDENQKPSRHPMMPTYPSTVLTVIDLTEEEPGRTRVTVTWEPAAGSTREEIESFLKIRGGMTMGWTGSFDKLEEYIARTRH